MCGRWATPFTKENIEQHYKVSVKGFTPSYNIVPGTEQIVVYQEEMKKAVKMKWGLIPSWANDQKIGTHMINARAETLLNKLSFRKPFHFQRCLIPCGGFYEWTHNSRKMPYYIHIKNSPLFSIAGLYDTWRDKYGKTITSFTIITTAANMTIKRIHDRMPIILKKDDENEWLMSQDMRKVQRLLVPFADDSKMNMYKVSQNVNNPEINELSNIRRVYV